jgi:hypothetical protein
MNLQEPENKNYAAIVCRITSLNTLENCDNVVGAPLFGYQAIVSKDTKIGQLGILFPPETQLSEEYARMNNLFRHSELNNDPTQAGYLEDNRRVKAMKFRGHTSNALFMPLSSIYYTGVETPLIEEGYIFDKIKGHEICRKYVIKEPNTTLRMDKNKVAKFRRVDNVAFPLHFDTDNYWRNSKSIPDDQLVTVTQKIHGTSIRIGRVKVLRKLSWLEKLAKKFGVKVAEEEYANVYGSRRTIKDPSDPDQQGYYESDIYTEEGKKLDDLVPDDYVFYGELIGWVGPGSPIQKDYTYNLPNGERALYIYRIAHVSNGGRTVVDLAWDQVKQMCNDLGLNHVPELWRGPHSEFNANDWMNIRYFDSGFKQAVPLSGSKKLVDEGVVVRVDRLVPYCLKAKSSIFLEKETKDLDKGVADLESIA